ICSRNKRLWVIFSVAALPVWKRPPTLPYWDLQPPVRPTERFVKVFEVGITVGAMPVSVRTQDAAFAQLLEQRYADFLHSERQSKFNFDIELAQPTGIDADADVRVRRQGPDWILERGDFHAQWRPEEGRGHIRQTANPYAIDSVLRI